MERFTLTSFDLGQGTNEIGELVSNLAKMAPVSCVAVCLFQFDRGDRAVAGALQYGQAAYIVGLQATRPGSRKTITSVSATLRRK